MFIHVKSKGGVNIQAWIEVVNFAGELEVVCEAKVIDAGNELFIDEIYTHPSHRRKGYASKLVAKLQTIKDVRPAGIIHCVVAESFWNHLGLEDALGEDRDQSRSVEQLLLDNSEFEFKIQAS